LFAGNPAGNATYCGMSYTNRGGDALSDTNTTAKGSLAWTALTGCLTTNEENIFKRNYTFTDVNGSICIGNLLGSEKIKIYNITGQNIQTILAQREKVVSKQVPSGIYIVRINESESFKMLLNN